MNTEKILSLRNKTYIFIINSINIFIANILDTFKEQLASSLVTSHVTMVLCYLLNILVMCYANTL